MGSPIQPSDLQFVTREFYLNGSGDYAKGSTLTFEELDTTLIFLSNSIANVNPNIDTSSLLLTASADLNVITFTKGDGTTQFTITVDTGSGQTYTAGNGIDINGSNVVSAKLGEGLNFDGSNQIQALVRTVNLQEPENGNISLSITNTITGPSSSLSGSPYFLPDTYSPRPPVSGTIFVVSGDGDPNKNGNAYIFVTSSTQAGSWQQIFGFNESTADARYVKLLSTSTQTITSSLLISGSTTFSGSLFWSGASDLGGSTNSVLVLGSDGQIYKTGSYGGGGGSTPSALTFGTQTTNYALASSDNNKVVRMNSSTNLTVYVTASLFSSGDQVIVFQSGSGQVTFIPDSTTEILSANNMRKLRTQYSAATLTFTGNTCYLFGDIAP